MKINIFTNACTLRGFVLIMSTIIVLTMLRIGLESLLLEDFLKPGRFTHNEFETKTIMGETNIDVSKDVNGTQGQTCVQPHLPVWNEDIRLLYRLLCSLNSVRLIDS